MELERTEAEREVDVLLLRRRRRLYLDQEGAHLFARYYWCIMAYDENSFRHKNQKRVLRKMLAKELIPFIYKNMTDFPFEECWPITGDQFEALDHNLSIKFPKLHAGRPWRAMAKCYNHAKQARSEFWKAALVKMAGEEMGRGLSDLNSFVNVHGYESLNEGVAEETTRLERSTDLEEAWHADAILFRRFCKIPLDQEGAHVFTRFYLAVMIGDENAFRFRWQEKIMGKMLAKVLIPFIYKNRVECMDETRWSITMEDFEALDYHLPIKFPKNHASRQWRVLAQCYNDIKQARSEFWKAQMIGIWVLRGGGTFHTSHHIKCVKKIRKLLPRSFESADNNWVVRGGGTPLEYVRGAGKNMEENSGGGAPLLH